MNGVKGQLVSSSTKKKKFGLIKEAPSWFITLKQARRDDKTSLVHHLEAGKDDEMIRQAWFITLRQARRDDKTSLVHHLDAGKDDEMIRQAWFIILRQARMMR